MENLFYFIQSGLLVPIAIIYLNSILEYKMQKKSYIWILGFAFFALASIAQFGKWGVMWETAITLLMFIMLCLFYRNWTKIITAISFLIIIIFLSEPIAYFTIQLLTQYPLNPQVEKVLLSSGGIASRIISAILLYFCANILRLSFSKRRIPFQYAAGCLAVPILSVFLVYNIFGIAFMKTGVAVSLISVVIILIINVLGFHVLIKLTEYYNEQIENQKSWSNWMHLTINKAA